MGTSLCCYFAHRYFIKKPIKIIHKELNQRGFLHVKTYGMDFIVTHLHPSSWEKRLNEANILVDYIHNNQLDSLLLLGDMNSHSPMDADYLENNSILLPLMRGGTTSQNFPLGNFDYYPIARFLSAPLLDVIQPYVKVEERMTFPTRILMPTPKNDYRFRKERERIDFLTSSLRHPKFSSSQIRV